MKILEKNGVLERTNKYKNLFSMKLFILKMKILFIGL